MALRLKLTMSADDLERFFWSIITCQERSVGGGTVV